MNSIKPIIPSIFENQKIICGFTTRYGGVSSSPFDSFNLGTSTPDNKADVRENYNIFYDYLGIEGQNAAFMKQIHGTNIGVADKGGIFPDTDSLITNKRGILLGVKTADCLPLLMHDPSTGSIGAVHCGWRSLVSGIAEKTIIKMKENFGTVPENIIAAGGQYAHSCCYEIGEEISYLFCPDSVIKREGKLYADLGNELRVRLVSAGIKPENIQFCGGCTVCSGDLFFSHRRVGVNSGRMLGYIMLT